MLKPRSVLMVLAAIAVLAALAVAVRGEGEGVLRRILPALHGANGGGGGH
jgi:hypothetical protein